MFSGTVESPGETSNDKHTLQYPPGEMVICLIPGSSGQVVQTRHLAALILELLHDTRWQLTKTPYDRTAGSRVECTCTTPAGSIHDPDCPVAHYNRLHNPMCVCGDPNATGVVHRQDGPCYQNRNHDPVNHPAHYTRGKIEVCDFILDQQLVYCLGNVVKYVTRADHKGKPLEDLKKAAWYLNREIARREALTLSTP